QKPSDAASVLFTSDNAQLDLKPDHPDRPLWIDPHKGRIIMESFSPSFKLAETFLINIAEPQSRVSRIHEYTLTPHSLFAAVSVGLTTHDILRQLDLLSKTPVPPSVRDFIINSTKSFGKVRLVLKHTKYSLESSDPAVLQKLLRDDIIGKHRVNESDDLVKESAPKMGNLAIPGTRMAAGAKQAVQKDAQQQQQQQQPQQDDEPTDADPQRDADRMAAALLEDDDDDDDERDQVHSFEIQPESVQEVSRRCRAIDLPLTEEYDFRNDEQNANLDIDLKPACQIRPYQEQALSKMFGNGRARSGIIVLPCGAGKTLVGITAACTVRKGVIVMCTSAMSVVQWRAEFLKWSNVNPNDIAVFTADHKDKFPGNTGIIISTYSMVTQSKGRSYDSQKVMDFIENREWGLMILDEVHVVPAEMFKKVTYRVKAHSKLGLTATLLREDDKIQDLNFLIGPKLYEANWQELSEQGHIARVQCAEVWCPMTTEFYTEYLRANNSNKRSLLFTMNPRKFQACQFLIAYHESRGDKVIVFSDNVYALEKYATRLGKAYIYGGTPQAERLRILENFQHNDQVNTVFLSKIGDTSLDLPEATCLIQISSHYGSRRQEAQRLGRILRAKRRNDEGFNAFFYSLVSKDTNEMYYSSKRQAFLVDQGYAFKVITHLHGIDALPNLAFTAPADRLELLQDVMLQSEDTAAVERIDGDLFSGAGAGGGARKRGVRRTAGALSELSGGQGMAYVEYQKSRNKELKGKGAHNSFMRKMRREQERKRAQK
ncbi:MAG: helicase-associated domain-containing protein, partial [Terriglobus roseus]|nr:helicase-associated domain-containing protein [Terriglobus roseus]